MKSKPGCWDCKKWHDQGMVCRRCLRKPYITGEEMTDYKVFSAQLRECREDGTAFDEKAWCCGQILIMCKRFTGLCSAAKCRAWRLKNTDGITAEDLSEGC